MRESAAIEALNPRIEEVSEHAEQIERRYAALVDSENESLIGGIYEEIGYLWAAFAMLESELDKLTGKTNDPT